MASSDTFRAIATSPTNPVIREEQRACHVRFVFMCVSDHLFIYVEDQLGQV